MRSFFKKIASFKNRLTRLNDEEPLTKLALAVIILLDFFVLSIVFGGLDDHTDQLTSPDEFFPYQCRQVFIQNDWTPANQTDRLQALVLTDYNNYSYRHESPFEKARIAAMHPHCRLFYDKIRLIAENEDLKKLFIERQDAIGKKNELVRHYDRENEVYDTKLLENIADKDTGRLDSMSKAMQGRAKEIDQLNARIDDLNDKISSDPLVADFLDLIRPGDTAQRERLVDDLNSFERRYLFRELLWQMLFLLPLLAVFWIWHSKSIQKARTIQGLISAHLIVVAAIPVVLKVIHVVMELIPYHFFKDLFDLLERLHIIALWHYAVIIATIGVAILLVFIIQKKIFSRARLREKRLMRGACFACGKKLPDRKSAACPFCGARQMRKCAACGADTFISGKFCAGCGREQAM